MLRFASFSLVAGMAVCVPVWAMGATLETVSPQLSVNRGQGYTQVTAPTQVSTGDRVMAAPSGRGKIVYADGCVVDVYPGAVMTVPAKCYTPMTAGLETPVEQARPIPWVPIVGAAVVVGVGVCAISGCFENGGHGHHVKPRSPDGEDDDNGDNGDHGHNGHNGED
jgi:hypothetical protein